MFEFGLDVLKAYAKLYHLMGILSASPQDLLLTFYFSFIFGSYVSLSIPSLISNTLTFFPGLDLLRDFFSFASPPFFPLSYLKQGEEMGQTLHTFTVLAHTHKYTQEVTDKGNMATRDGERESCVVSEFVRVRERNREGDS